MPDLKDALDLLETGTWVKICYISFDDKRNIAGEIVRINRCRILKKEKSEKSEIIQSKSIDPNQIKKDPNHYENATRNVKLANGTIRKFHIRLLFAINGHKII